MEACVYEAQFARVAVLNDKSCQASRLGNMVEPALCICRAWPISFTVAM